MTRYRVAPRLFSLDRYGNVLFYFSFNKNSRFGWTALSDTGDAMGICTPVHWKAALALEQHAKALAAQELQLQKPVDSAPSATGPKEPSPNTTSGTKPTPQPPSSHISRPSTPVLRKSQLRFHPFLGRFYKSAYWSVMGCGAVFLSVQYLLFRQWLNPPALEGLKKIEEKALSYPAVLAGRVEQWWTESPLPETVKGPTVEAIAQANQFARQSYVDLATRYGYNPNFETERLEYQRRLEADRSQSRQQSINWMKGGAFALLSAISVLCLV
jgi:hypothetical protein